MVAADFRSVGTEDLAIINQTDNTLTILLNQGTGVVPQFAQPTSGIGLISPVALGTNWTSSTPRPPWPRVTQIPAPNTGITDTFAVCLLTIPWETPSSLR